LLDAKRYRAITLAISRKPRTSTTRRAAQAAAHLTMSRLGITTTPFVRGLATAACLIIATCAANAQASRTWVSAFGNDANPCSRTAPCRTFAGAIAKTAAGGEIDVLDPGEFGAVTITKALTIDGGGGQVASVTVAAPTGHGILVQAGPNDVVTLRNLRINGIGSGLHGIRFVSGAAIHIQNCYVFGFRDNGIEITGAGHQAHISDTVISNNGNDGIRVGATGPDGTLVALVRVQMNNHNNYGLMALPLGSFGAITVSVTDSQASNNGGGIFAYGASVIVNRSAIVNNNSWGGLLTWPEGVIVVGNSSIGGNSTGVDATQGTILTNGNNSLIGNFISDGTFSGPAPLQ
jgi:hypothetical protein